MLINSKFRFHIKVMFIVTLLDRAYLKQRVRTPKKFLRPSDASPKQ